MGERKKHQWYHPHPVSKIPATAAPPYPECLSSPNNNTLKSFINFHYPAQASMGEHTRDMRLSLSFPYQICLSYKHRFGKNSHEKMNFCFVNHPTIRDDTWNNFNVQKIQRRGEFRPCVSLLPCCLSFDLRHDQFLEGFKEEDIKSSLVIQNQKSISIHFLCIHLPFRDTENFSCQV